MLKFAPAGSKSWSICLFFGIAVLFHLTVYGFYLFPAVFMTNSLTEPDDAYAYIHKANAAIHCVPLTKCLSYASVLEQARRSPVIPALQDRYIGRILCNYSVLHSLALNGFRFALGSWEIAYACLVIFGGLFLALAFTLLVGDIFGLGAAGIFLLFFTTLKYPGAGWQYIVPTNLCVALAVMSWWFCRREGKYAVIAASLCAGFSVLMHPLGFALAGISAALLLVKNRKKLRRGLGSAAVLVGIAILAKLVAGLFKAPGVGCSFGAHLGLDLLNVDVSIRSVLQWFLQQRGGFASVFILLGLGFISLTRSKREFYSVILALLLCLMGLGLFYVLPGYPGELVIRLLLPLGLLLSGCWAAGAFSLIRFCYRKGKARSFSALAVVAYIALAGLLVDRLIVAKRGLLGPVENWESLLFWQRAITRLPDFYMEDGQAEALRQLVPPGETIVYAEEESLYHALANGLVDRKAVFLPLLGADDPFRMPGRQEIYSFASPVQPFLLEKGLVALTPGKNSSPITAFLLQNRSFSPVEILIESGSYQETLSLNPRSKRWYELKFPARNESITLAVKIGRFVVLEGVRAGQKEGLHWPWDSGWTFSQSGQNSSTDSALAACAKGCGWPKTILADGGYTVLARYRGTRKSGANKR
ncbi:MAG: hypothetical protein AB7K68_05150 [Bacteriovoracia bacterium]